MRRRSEQPVVVFGKGGKLGGGVLGKAFAVVDDLGRVLEIDALFGQDHLRKMDVEQLRTAPCGVQLGKHVRIPLERHGRLGSEMGVALRLGVTSDLRRDSRWGLERRWSKTSTTASETPETGADLLPGNSDEGISSKSKSVNSENEMDAGSTPFLSGF